MRKIKAFVYVILGGMMCWNTFQKEYYVMTACIGLFTFSAIVITLASLGTRKIMWDEKGITIEKFPSASKFVRWEQLEKIRVDHLGYHIRASTTRFKISFKNMPESLLEKIRESIKANKR